MDPLNKPGDLSVFGASEKPTLPADEMPENDVVELKEEPSLILPVEDEVQAEAQEETEEVQEPSVLQQVLSKEKESDESELTQLRQKNARLEGELQGRLMAVENQIRQGPAAPEPEVKEESMWDSPAVSGMLRELQDKDPDQVLPAIGRVLEEQLGEKIEKKVQAVRDEAGRKQQEDQRKTLAKQVLAGVHEVLANIKSEGGMTAEIVDDFYNREEESLLYKRFQKNEGIIYAGVDGIRGAIMGIETELRERQKAQQSTPASVTPVAEVSAGTGQPSTRALKLGEKPKKKTEEEGIVDAMFDVGHRKRKIDFL